MTKQVPPILLRWSEHVPASDMQDPLGLALRGSARLASQLLFCITSITPRARYFSFLPWCVQDWQKREKGQPFALGLREAIALRERALILGCIAHHLGKPCTGGALVGSDNVAKWFAEGHADIELGKLPFAKYPALGAYLNSLANLGFFVETKVVDKSDEDPEVNTLAFDDLQLTGLGRQLAEGYDSLVGQLESVRDVSALGRRCEVRTLSEWGKLGGFCELAEPTAPDRQLLRDIFFARAGLKSGSHLVRRHSLLLTLELCRQMGEKGWTLSEPAFTGAVYFGEVLSADEELLKIEWPEPLKDIAARWKMFYFHHYMSVALEGMFAWLVTQLAGKGLAGASVGELVQSLNSAAVKKAIADLLKSRQDDFGLSSPSRVFQHFTGAPSDLNARASRLLDERRRSTDSISEARLESVIRSAKHLHSPVGLAVPMLLLGLTLGRYRQWEETSYGNWLASASRDSYLDLVPPVLTMGLTRRFGQWWERSWSELTEFVLLRYVVQQHQSMSYEKTALGERCLLQVDGNKVMSSAAYDEIGIGNVRFGRAVSILKDLALLENTDAGLLVVTNDGIGLLREELAREDRE